jgi:hypothetical protein
MENDPFRAFFCASCDPRRAGSRLTANQWETAAMSVTMRAALAVPMIVFAVAAGAQDTAPPLPFDSPVSMRSMEAVCTGIGADARTDPRWASYPLRIEIVGRTGEYLGQATIDLAQNGEAVLSARCGGPWLLLRVPPGMYDVSVMVENIAKMAKANVPMTGQGRVVIRFPELGAEAAK